MTKQKFQSHPNQSSKRSLRPRSHRTRPRHRARPPAPTASVVADEDDVVAAAVVDAVENKPLRRPSLRPPRKA